MANQTLIHLPLGNTKPHHHPHYYKKHFKQFLFNLILTMKKIIITFLTVDSGAQKGGKKMHKIRPLIKFQNQHSTQVYKFNSSPVLANI